MFTRDLPSFFAVAITLIIAFTIHEFAHAWTADQLGDDTPRAYGRLTLNPLAHLDLIGTLMLFLAGFGWAKPVPVNLYALQRRTPAGLMLVAAAGPLSNLVLAIAAAIPFRAGLLAPSAIVGTVLPSLSGFLVMFISINLFLLFFNLIPLAPLDGEKVLSYFLPPNGQRTMDRIRPYGPMILMALIVLGRFGSISIFGLLVSTPAILLRNLLIG